MKHLQFFYFLFTTAAGIVSLSISVFAYIKTKEILIRYYLYFYASFSLLVVLGGLLAYIEANIPTIRPDVFNILHHGASMTEFLLLLTLPVFMHYLLAVSQARLKNLIFGGIALSLAVLNYGAEYSLADGASLPDIRDYVKGFVLLIVILYVLLLGIVSSRTLQDQLRKKTAGKFVVLLGVSLLTITADTVLEGRSPFFFFPIAYCGLSIVFTHHFLRYYLHQIPGAAGSISETAPRVSAEELFQQYNISPREQEVIRFVLQGYSNQQIGDTLFISLSTVKKHISNIFLKCDLKSRYELIALFKNIALDSIDQTNSGQETTTN